MAQRGTLQACCLPHICQRPFGWRPFSSLLVRIWNTCRHFCVQLLRTTPLLHGRQVHCRLMDNGLFTTTHPSNIGLMSVRASVPSKGDLDGKMSHYTCGSVSLFMQFLERQLSLQVLLFWHAWMPFLAWPSDTLF